MSHPHGQSPSHFFFRLPQGSQLLRTPPCPVGVKLAGVGVSIPLALCIITHGLAATNMSSAKLIDRWTPQHDRTRWAGCSGSSCTWAKLLAALYAHRGEPTAKLLNRFARRFGSVLSHAPLSLLPPAAYDCRVHPTAPALLSPLLYLQTPL